MKKLSAITILLLVICLLPVNSYAQKPVTGQATITASDLETHLTFLASPNMKGRLNGSNELEIAASYLAAQLKKSGIKPVEGNNYIVPYSVVKKMMDPEKTSITVSKSDGTTTVFREPIYQLFPMGASDFELEGDVVFAGYGIKADKYKYDDFDTLNLKGKIILIMHRAPVAADGKKGQFDDQRYMSINGLQMKLTPIMMKGAKAVIIVSDPKSGTASLNEVSPDITNYLESSMTLKGAKSQNFDMPGLPKIMFVHRKVADELLAGTGKSLPELQNAIDSDLKCHSFAIKGKTLKIKETSLSVETQMPNVAGFIEGSDPELKKEVIVFSGHMDHVGGSGDNLKPGADDNASGCSALLELAEAFNSLPKKPLRSILFLWVSGEEVGLFGSQAYVNNPLVPLENTVADLNMDMIGRVKGVADTTKETPMTGPRGVFVITDDQSKELREIANAAGKKNDLTLDYSLSGKDHPLMLFARSDHFNFVKKDIPVLFFTTGLHSDYHKTGDVVSKIDFKKMELITRTMYDIGFQVANRKQRLTVDNPFSKWENNPFKQMMQ